MKDIKPGYMIKITTWENDGDNYNTVSKEGLTADEARFYWEVAHLFTSKNYRQEEAVTYGNADVGTVREEVNDSIGLIAQRFREKGLGIPKDWDIEAYEDKEWLEKYGDDFYSDSLYDIVGIWCEGEYYRVFESAEVFLIPEAIKNVTDEIANRVT